MKWEPQFFGSGTCIVTSNQRDEPHYYVYGPHSPDDGQRQRNRIAMCHQLADWLNGGDRPLWLDDMKRTHEDGCFDLDGTKIFATGPSVLCDCCPPHKMHWLLDESDEAVSKRARLIDRLFEIDTEVELHANQ